jgi:recombination DNA repair RAD52 pathway protein
MFSEQQTKELTAPLSKAHVKKNPKGFDYVEGWHAIAEANRVFGFDAWDRQTLEMRQLGEPEQVNGNWRVAYHCRVRITVRAGETIITRDGSGYGSGIVKDIRDAHEGAIKEAETDAMKRALMTFGNPFGLALYDKAQANVVEEVDESYAKFLDATRDIIRTSSDPAAIREWWQSDDQKKMRRDFGLTEADLKSLMAFLKARLESLEGKKKAA